MYLYDPRTQVDSYSYYLICTLFCILEHLPASQLCLKRAVSTEHTGSWLSYTGTKKSWPKKGKVNFFFFFFFFKLTVVVVVVVVVVVGINNQKRRILWVRNRVGSTVEVIAVNGTITTRGFHLLIALEGNYKTFPHDRPMR